MTIVEMELPESLLTHPSHYKAMKVNKSNVLDIALFFLGYDCNKEVALFWGCGKLRKLLEYEGFELINQNKDECS